MFRTRYRQRNFTKMNKPHIYGGHVLLDLLYLSNSDGPQLKEVGV
jgi:hypothetical protein